MLKNIAEVIAEPLSSLFTKLMNSGYFPSEWKKANVIPVHKKADKQNKENYRPISLLSCLGKVMERIIYNELYEYCESNDFFNI